MTSRDVVLGRIRGALAGSAPADPVPRDYAHTGGLGVGSDAVVDLLVDRLEDYRATVHRGPDLAAAIDAALGPARSVVVPAGLDPAVRAACAAGGRQVITDRADLSTYDLDGIDAVVTGATVAIAETGTIILDGSADQGRRAITLVPDRHVIVLSVDRVVHSVPEGLALVAPTAPLTMISGPSATSDIELSRVEGVHGPRTLEVVLTG